MPHFCQQHELTWTILCNDLRMYPERIPGTSEIYLNPSALTPLTGHDHSVLVCNISFFEVFSFLSWLHILSPGSHWLPQNFPIRLTMSFCVSGKWIIVTHYIAEWLHCEIKFPETWSWQTWPMSFNLCVTQPHRIWDYNHEVPLGTN
jgi:hypothetical protein